jgi:hypothetical protein
MTLGTYAKAVTADKRTAQDAIAAAGDLLDQIPETDFVYRYHSGSFKFCQEVVTQLPNGGHVDWKIVHNLLDS